MKHFVIRVSCEGIFAHIALGTGPIRPTPREAPPCYLMRITNTDALEITTQSVEAMSVAIAARSAHAPGSIEQGPPAPFNSQEEVEVWLRERRAQGKAGILSRIIAHEKKKLSEFEVIQDEVNAMRVKNRIKELQEQLVKLSTT